ncbi:MAG TPA: phosphoglucosamine mutase, partial [Ruminococcus flavefaciens]|nr:phosphoglucosamine mutase [Ruminococcus flavefaciens]
ADMVKLPQVMVNVRIDPQFKELWKNDKEVSELIKELDSSLGEEGRIIVRESGTEPLIRIMAEGSDFGRINDIAFQISDKLKEKFRIKKPS